MSFTHINWDGLKEPYPLLGTLYVWMLSVFHVCRRESRSKSQSLQPETQPPNENYPLHWDQVPQTCESGAHTLGRQGFLCYDCFFLDIAVHTLLWFTSGELENTIVLILEYANSAAPFYQTIGIMDMQNRFH
ncbi:unnamed protein product [Pipistrellus nathusii]|uniref:Vomeronasal type-1 receptor n=1 Tax=Pipistrellus nathusii TaxID=59473 RepID=A0ABP0ACT6_PIPNA